MRGKCYTPLAAGPSGVSVCILEEGHDGPCDGGDREQRICEDFAAYTLLERCEYDYWETWSK
jgi:hypothetical protein